MNSDLCRIYYAPRHLEPELQALLAAQGFIRNEDLRYLLGLTRMQATWKLQRWVDADLVRLEGRGRGARYYPTARQPGEENA